MLSKVRLSNSLDERLPTLSTQTITSFSMNWPFIILTVHVLPSWSHFSCLGQSLFKTPYCWQFNSKNIHSSVMLSHFFFQYYSPRSILTFYCSHLQFYWNNWKPISYIIVYDTCNMFHKNRCLERGRRFMNGMLQKRAQIYQMHVYSTVGKKLGRDY